MSFDDRGAPDVIQFVSFARLDARVEMRALVSCWLFGVLHSPSASAVQLVEFLQPKQTCVSQTGFQLRTLQQIWDTYHNFGGSMGGTFGGQLTPPQRGGLMSRAYHFFCVFLYIHKCPQIAWEETFELKVGHTVYTMSEGHWQPMWDVANALANIISEIRYDDRLHPYNHVGQPFKYHVTGIVDTFPIYVPAPHDFAQRQLLFQPKYDACVLKMQLGISFMGNIILWTGPHFGTTADITIWEQTWVAHPFLPWEWWLADLGYVGALGLLYKWKRAAQQPRQPPPPALTPLQLFYNNVHEFYRNRVEQIVAVVKSHHLFADNVFKGSAEHLFPLVTIVGHVTALELRMRQHFETFGPWQHHY